MAGAKTYRRFSYVMCFVAPDLIGKIIVIRSEENMLKRYMITETRLTGYGDEACHASRDELQD